ncbi:hypothetical protein CDL15_Pgr028069 [Punica granatum]|nr:hypothetical protein CDL15_Pgr028069 [Punica granatum]PKI50917.1 hypothetical protein CRG98_028647 [Punica granatum]
MFPFLKSLSRTVHGEQCNEEQQPEYLPKIIPTVRRTHDAAGHRQEEENLIVKGGAVKPGTCKSLTVWRKSLLVSCKGFTVIDSNGNLAYRVDNYTRHRPQEVVLMDATGKSVLTLRRQKKLGILGNWLVYEGEVGSNTIKSRKKPLCCVRKQMNALSNARSRILASVSSCSGSLRSSGKRDFVIEGSYANRSCKVVEEESLEVVAEVRRKEEMVRGVAFGLEVFVLVVQPGFDVGFAMALVLLLDQMFS